MKGVGDQQDYGMRIYDPRVGRFLSVDPMTEDFSELTPYQFASNSPIQAIDFDGLEAFKINDPTNGQPGTTYGPYEDEASAEQGARNGNKVYLDPIIIKASKRSKSSADIKPSINDINAEVTALDRSKGNTALAPWMLSIIKDAATSHGNPEDKDPTYTMANNALKSVGLSNPVKCPWCAAYGSEKLKESGYENPQSASSSAWLKSKTLIQVPHTYYGAIVIFQDYSDQFLLDATGSGHIGFLYAVTSDGNYIILGGNQSDMLKFSRFPETSNYIKSIGYMHIEGFFFPKDYNGPLMSPDTIDNINKLNKILGVKPRPKQPKVDKTQ